MLERNSRVNAVCSQCCWLRFHSCETESTCCSCARCLSGKTASQNGGADLFICWYQMAFIKLKQTISNKLRQSRRFTEHLYQQVFFWKLAYKNLRQRAVISHLQVNWYITNNNITTELNLHTCCKPLKASFQYHPLHCKMHLSSFTLFQVNGCEIWRISPSI